MAVEIVFVDIESYPFTGINNVMPEFLIYYSFGNRDLSIPVFKYLYNCQWETFLIFKLLSAIQTMKIHDGRIHGDHKRH